MEIRLETGELDKYITIQSVPKVENEDGALVDGTPIDEWPDVPAQFLEFTGREFEQARQMSAETVGRVRMRYIPDITPRHQFTFEDDVYHLTVVNDIGKRHDVLELHYKTPVKGPI